MSQVYLYGLSAGTLTQLNSWGPLYVCDLDARWGHLLCGDMIIGKPHGRMKIKMYFWMEHGIL